MARYCGSKNSAPILSAALRWKDACLVRDGSVFSDAYLWRDEHLEALQSHFVDAPDEGEGTFFTKLEGQLAATAPEAKQLAAEMLWVMFLCPSNVTPQRKREGVQTIWGWSGAPPDALSPWLTEEILDGIGSAGTSFGVHRWRELTFFIRAMKLFKALPDDERSVLLADGWKFAKWSESVPESDTRQLRHMLLFLLFPDSFERIFSGGDRRLIVQNFSGMTRARVRSLSALEIDRELARARAAEQEKLPDKPFNYESPLQEQWQTEDFDGQTAAVEREHVLAALAEIDEKGVPTDAESTVYDLIHGVKRYRWLATITLAGRRQLSWPVEHRCRAGPGGGVYRGRSTLNEGSRSARQEDHGPPSAQVQATPHQAQPGGGGRQGRHQRAQRAAHRRQRGACPRSARNEPGAPAADPLAAVWDSEVVPLLEADAAAQRGDAAGGAAAPLPGQLRRRRAAHAAAPRAPVARRARRRARGLLRAGAPAGPTRAVGLHRRPTSSGVVIAGVAFPHRLYQFALAHSGWRHARVVAGGESFIALSTGLQAALWRLGGVPEEHRTDSLSAAFNNLAEEQELTRRYDDAVPALRHAREPLQPGPVARERRDRVAPRLAQDGTGPGAAAARHAQLRRAQAAYERFVDDDRAALQRPRGKALAGRARRCCGRCRRGARPSTRRCLRG